jgi:hypothetical protein
MASKYQLITDLYESTIQAVTNTPAAWTAFLRSACRNYKCRFDEQILIYAQRPDATAVLEIEKWNEQFGRWVNRGAKGIAVFDDEHNGNYRLKHYFDISDTHESRFARRVPLWQMEPRFETEVIESLENSFGELEDKATLADALISAAHNAVEDNLSDYLNELIYCREDSLLEELDELNIEMEYRTSLQNSVAYMLLTRCGIDVEDYLEPLDFRYAPTSTPAARSTPWALPPAILRSCACWRLRPRCGICGFRKGIQIAHLQSRKARRILYLSIKTTKGVLTMELTYRMEGDYRVPNLTVPEESPVILGKYALLRKKYLKQHRRVLYLNLLTAGTLNAHLTEIEQTATSRMEQLTVQMAAAQGVTEKLKPRIKCNGSG